MIGQWLTWGLQVQGNKEGQCPGPHEAYFLSEDEDNKNVNRL